MTETAKVEIKMAAIRAVLPFIATQDVRYYLNGIYVEAYESGVLAVATNGHVLGVYTAQGGYCAEPCIIGVDKYFRAALAKSYRYQRVVEEGAELLEIKGDPPRAYISAHGEESFIRPGKTIVDGKYPDWRKVVPPKDCLSRGLPIALNAEYLAAIKTALPKRRQRAPLQFFYDNRTTDGNAAIVRTEEMPELLMVIMSMRSKTLGPWPSWMRDTSPPKPVPETSSTTTASVVA